MSFEGSCSDAEGQIGEHAPVLLRGDLVARLGAVGVGVDQSRDDGLAADVDALGVGRDLDLADPADGFDSIARYDDDSGLEDLLLLGGVAHGDDATPDEGDPTRRNVGGDGEGEIDPLFDRLGQLRRRRSTEEGEGVGEAARVERRTVRPVKGGAVGRPVQELTGPCRDLAGGEGLHLRIDGDRLAGGDEGCHPDLVALAKGDPPSVRRQTELGDLGALQVDALVEAVERDALEHPLGLILDVGEVDAVAGGGEVGVDARFRDPFRLAAGAVDDVEPGSDRPARRQQVATGDLAIDDPLPVGGVVSRP